MAGVVIQDQAPKIMQQRSEFRTGYPIEQLFPKYAQAIASKAPSCFLSVPWQDGDWHSVLKSQ